MIFVHIYLDVFYAIWIVYCYKLHFYYFFFLVKCIMCCPVKAIAHRFDITLSWSSGSLFNILLGAFKRAYSFDELVFI